MLHVTAAVIRLCKKHHIIVSLENPRSSRLWITPVMLQLLRTASKWKVDFCQYGTEWKKPTLFCIWSQTALVLPDQLCHPVHNLCSQSGKRHRVLQGVAPGGKNWTAIAEPCPTRLTTDFARAVDALFRGKAAAIRQERG